MHIFTLEDLQNALDVAEKSHDEEKDEENEEWRNIFVHILRASELGSKAFEIGHAQRKNVDDGISERQRTMNDYCEDYREQANLYDKSGEYQKTIDYSREAVVVAQKVGDKVREGIAFHIMGVAYGKINEYQKEIECFCKSLEIYKELGDKGGISIAHEIMATAYENMGEYQKAIDCSHKSLKIAKELGDIKGIGRVYGVMANAYRSISEYQKATDCHRKHLKIAEELGDKGEKCTAHRNMGILYNDIGEYQKAIDCHRKALEIAEELGDRGGIGAVYGNMGNAYDNIGEYQEAIDCHRKGLAIAEELGDKGGIGTAHTNMGNAYRKIGEYQKAIECYRKRLEIAVELGDKGGISIAYGNMGILCNDIDEYQKSIDYHRKALEIAEEFGDIRMVAETKRNIGFSYQRNNNDRLACSFLAKSILSYQKIRRFEVYEDGLNTSISNVFAEVHKIFFKSLLNLKQVKSALLVSDSGKAKALYDLTRRCVDVAMDPALDEYSTIAIQAIADDPCLKTNEAFLDIALSQVIYLMQDENIISYTYDHEHNLHVWVISKKGFFHKSLKAVNSMSTKTYVEVQNLPKNVSHSPEQAEKFNFGGMRIKEKSCAKKNHLDLPFIGKKDDRVNKFTHDLEERVENLTSSETTNCDPNIAVVTSLMGRYNLDGSTKNQHGENEKDMKKVVGRYSLERPNVTTHGQVKNGTDYQAAELAQGSLQMALEKLYSIYISPIEEYLVGSKILVVPEGSLFKVPFCALINSKKEHLCDRYSLQFTSALHVLNASLSNPLPKIGPALFVGNPIVGEVKFDDVREWQIPQLPNTKVEAEECSKYFNAKPLLEEKATKENVLKSMKYASVIHIAAHGDMAHDAILLAPNEGAPKPPSGEHYFLTAKDVVECSLRARLVVLSCCHSGQGQISAEGVVGIARSFLGAGARSVLVSIWRLLDAETVEFMKLFYDKVIQGISVCVALQQTMIEIKKKYEMEAWSYFQIVGEDISLSKDEIEEIRRQSSARTGQQPHGITPSEQQEVVTMETTLRSSSKTFLWFTIDKHGGTTSFPAASAYLYFPKDAVSKPVTIKCVRVRHENCSAKQREGEGFCSSIMKMEPEGLVFDEPVTVLLCHSAPEEGAYRDYYDVTVQKLEEECDDLDTIRISNFEDLPQEIASNFNDIGKYLPVASATVRETCTLAVSTRIRSENIVVLPTKPYIYSKSYGNESKLTISFPAGAVKTECSLAVQVLPADEIDSTMSDDLMCFPIIEVSGCDETFTQPVKVELDYRRDEVAGIEQEFLPIDRTISFSSTYGVLLRSHKDLQGRQIWEDVTDKVNATILRLENDQVRISFSVTHFSKTSGKLKKREKANTENSKKYGNLCARLSVYLILSLHDLNQLPSILYSVLSPKHKKGEMEEVWGSGAKVCQLYLKPQERIFFCVPVSSSDHIRLDVDNVCTLPDDVTYSFNDMNENINIERKSMWFLRKKCEDSDHSGESFVDRVFILRRITMVEEDRIADPEAERIQTGSGSSAVGKARSEDPEDLVLKTSRVRACLGCTNVLETMLATPKPPYENNPSVFPVLSGNKVLGTGFVLQWQNKCYVISLSIAREQCYALIPVQNEFQSVYLIPGSENNNLVATSLKEDSGMLKLSAASEDSLDNGKKIYMVSRLAPCRYCGKFQTKFLSKSCQVESSIKDSYNYKKKGGVFKDFPVGAPVVNEKNEVVGIIKSYETDGLYFEVAAIAQRGVFLLKDQGRTSPSC